MHGSVQKEENGYEELQCNGGIYDSIQVENPMRSYEKPHYDTFMMTLTEHLKQNQEKILKILTTRCHYAPSKTKSVIIS